MNIFQWNVICNSEVIIQENAYGKGLCKIFAIKFWPIEFNMLMDTKWLARMGDKIVKYFTKRFHQFMIV